MASLQVSLLPLSRTVAYQAPIMRLRWLIVNKREFPKQELHCKKALDRVEKQPAK
jgi:hypothetical protein